MNNAPRPDGTQHSFESLDDALYDAQKTDSRVMLWAPGSGHWVVHPCQWTPATAAGAYAKELTFSRIGRIPAPVPLYLLASDRSTARRWEPGATDPHQPWVEAPGFLVDIDPSEITELQTQPENSGLLDKVFEQLISRGFTPDVHPYSLADVADFLFEGASESLRGDQSTLGTARARSSFPFHEFEALSGGGPLAHHDASHAVATMRAQLECCDLVFAERWAHIVQIDMRQETAFIPDPSPTTGMAFSPEAHHLQDWLEVTVRELAEGRGNLVVLARTFAENLEFEEDPHEPGLMSAKNRPHGDPWSLFIADRGALTQIRLRGDIPVD